MPGKFVLTNVTEMIDHKKGIKTFHHHIIQYCCKRLWPCDLSEQTSCFVDYNYRIYME